MAIPVVVLEGDAEITPAAFAAPLASESVAVAGDRVWLWVKNGATTSSVTLAAPANDNPGRVPRAAKVIATFANGDRIIRLGRRWVRADGTIGVTFSAVTTVTCVILDGRPASES